MSNGYTIRRLVPALATLLACGDNAGAWQLRWVNGAGSTAITSTPPGMAAATFDVAKMQCVQARQRFFCTSDNMGVLALDSEGDTTVRAAGFRALNPFSNGFTSTNAQALPATSACSYKFVWRRKQSDGYEVLGEPSLSYLIKNTQVIANDPNFRITFATSADVQAGDYIDVYRTKVVTPETSDPGSTFFLSTSVLLTAGNIAAGFLDVRDRVADSMLGEELYTNPGRPVPPIIGVGGSYANSPPGLATDSWNYKGRTFYATQRVPSFLKFRINGRWGNLVTAVDRATGIGQRIIAGDTAIGSANIINISAANMVGLVVGQLVECTAGFATRPTITAVGATSITVNANANANNVGTSVNVFDQIEVNGQKGIASNLSFFLGEGGAIYPEAFSSPSQTAILITTSPAIASTGSSTNTDCFGITVIARQGRYGDGVLTIRATNEQNFSPPVANISATATNGGYDERFNRLNWSKDNTPEAAPPQQELLYGNGTHYRGIATKDCVYLFASDGLWRKSGDNDNFRVDPVDPKLILAGRNAVTVLNGVIYAYTNRGLVRITASGSVEEVGRDVIADLIPGAPYADTWDTFLSADELHREVWVSFRSGGSSRSYVYSEFTNMFVDAVDGEWSALEWAPYLQSLVVGMVDTAPDVNYFELDTSLTRMAGAQLSFQPLTGDGNPFTQKQWVDMDLLFEGVTTPLQADLVYSGITGQTAAQVATAPVQGVESRSRKGFPRSAAMQNVLQPRLNFGTGSTTQNWTFRGFSTRYSVLTEDSGRRA